MAAYKDQKSDLAIRLKRAEGQIRGIRKMIDEEKYCIDVLNQISAVKGALKKVELKILEEHTKGCLKNALVSGSEDYTKEMIQELLKTIEKMM
ncbi:MAG TPA: metal-sensitive transcriptional regulator [Clostridia bacterium]|jgi:DNA-binding FrmR family transcriptional regulator|nr:metal-sensitive transcriptional regulator [Clostridia bacterium]